MKKIILVGMLIFSTCLLSKAQNVSGNCYRGFVDVGYDAGIGDYGFGRYVIGTTHGYQLNPYIFVGAGAAFHFMSKYETNGSSNIPLDIRESKVDIPVYANVHLNFMKGKVTPFIDGKAGTFVTNNGGMMWNLSAGCRIATNKRQAVNISIGYAAEKLEFETFDSFIGYSSMDYTRERRTCDTECVTLRVGYEF